MPNVGSGHLCDNRAISRGLSLSLFIDEHKEVFHAKMACFACTRRRRYLERAGGRATATASTAATAATAATTAADAATSTAAAAKHPRHHGRRCGLVQRRRLPSRNHVGQDAEPRQAGIRRHDVHGLLRRSELHGRPRELYYRGATDPYWADDRRPSWGGCRHTGGSRHARHCPEGTGLCYRAIRQEPSRGPEQIPSDRTWLR